MNVLKPVVYLTVGNERFHWATTPGTPNARITDFKYEDTDGTDKDNKKKKGKRDELSFSFPDFDESTQTFLTDGEIFKIGSQVKFKFGFEGLKPLSMEKIFQIVDVQNKFPEGIETATVICHDLSKQLNTKVKDVTRPITGRVKNEIALYSLHTVIKECAEEAGLIYVRDDPFFGTIKLNGWQQKKETNIKFLSRIASQYGAEVYVEGKELHFRKKNSVVKQPVWGDLHRGQNAEFFNKQQTFDRVALMLNFNPKVNVEETAASSESSDASSEDGENKKSKSIKTETRTAPFSAAQGRVIGLFTAPTLTPEQEEAILAPIREKRKKRLEAKQQAQDQKEGNTPRTKKDGDLNNKASQQQGAEAAITASATVLGDVELKAKITVLTTGRLSKRWLGHLWYVESCTHKIDSNGYFCELSLTAPPDTGTKDENKADDKKQDKRIEKKRFVGFSEATSSEDGRKITETRENGVLVETVITNRNDKLKPAVSTPPKPKKQ